MSDISQAAIERASQSSMTFAKFLSPNDTGLTGGHQCGIYIPQQSAEILFDDTFARGENHERRVRIIWNEGQWDRESRFVYYGQPNQLRQMRKANVTLVVPAPYHKDYPSIDDGAEIISLEDFISKVLKKQSAQCDNAPARQVAKKNERRGNENVRL